MSKTSTWITTYSGKKFDAFNPQNDTIDIKDIAHGLSLICRYCGQCRFFYSVGQHSIIVSDIIAHLGYDKRMQMYGLLHDASESYICDIPKDIKHNMPEYQQIEEVVQNAIWQRFGLTVPTVEEKAIIKQADNMALRREAEILMQGWEEWEIPTYDISIPKIYIEPVKMGIVEEVFLMRYEKLARYC